MKIVRCMALAILALVVTGAPAAAEPPLAAMTADRGEVVFTPQLDAERFVLTVSQPDGTVVRREFAAGKAPTFSLFAAGQPVPDGSYRYELTAVPRLSAEAKRALAAARDRGAAALAAEQKRAGLGDIPRVESGSFRVAQGQVVDDAQVEPLPARPAVSSKATPDAGNNKDQVIPDDLIVQGSTCIGFDCVNNESFGFDTIRLKENSTRIKFEDTSVGGFPSNDWQLTANDAASGGTNRFSIEDITGSRVPFTLLAGAPTNSIFVDSGGRVGLRTSTPVLDLHLNTGNTPAIRLEQNGAFGSYTWDVAGNEVNFFVRDVPGGSRLPFRIRPGAPTSSVDISTTGEVGFGTASPDAKIHVLGQGDTGAGNTTKILVQNNSGTNGSREMLELRNNGGNIFVLNDTNLAARWAYGQEGTDFVMDRQGVGAGVEFRLTSAGNLTVPGTVNGASSRSVKENFAAVDPKSVLSRVVSLPISFWSYKSDDGDNRHMGPMAEDFFAAFGLGQGEKTIAMVDSDGVALAAIQGLYALVQEKDRENAELKSRLARLETLVGQLATQAGVALSARP